MMKLIIIILGVVMTTGFTHAEAIGFVDMQKVFVNYKETDQHRKDFEKKQEALTKELEEKKKLVEKAQKDNAKPEEIQKLVMEIQEELQPKQEELMQLNGQIMAKIRLDIIKSTKKVAKEYGIDLVLDQQAVLSGGFDLTDFVLEDLND